MRQTCNAEKSVFCQIKILSTASGLHRFGLPWCSGCDPIKNLIFKNIETDSTLLQFRP